VELRGFEPLTYSMRTRWLERFLPIAALATIDTSRLKVLAGEDLRRSCCGREPSHQIEHHLFPDVPAHRYSEIASEVREI
jgi:fatty acid desaturase